MLENKFSVRPSNAGATQLINKLQDEADLYTRKVSTQLFWALAACCWLQHHPWLSTQYMLSATGQPTWFEDVILAGGISQHNCMHIALPLHIISSSCTHPVLTSPKQSCCAGCLVSVLIVPVHMHAASWLEQIQLERRKVLMLLQQLEQLTNKLGTTRSAMGSIFSAKEKTQALQKQIKILENRLEKQYIKHNEVCACTTAMPLTVDSPLRTLVLCGQICARSPHSTGTCQQVTTTKQQQRYKCYDTCQGMPHPTTVILA